MTHEERLELVRRCAGVAGNAETFCSTLNSDLPQVKVCLAVKVYEATPHQTGGLHDGCTELSEFMLSLKGQGQ